MAAPGLLAFRRMMHASPRRTLPRRPPLPCGDRQRHQPLHLACLARFVFRDGNPNAAPGRCATSRTTTPSSTPCAPSASGTASCRCCGWVASRLLLPPAAGARHPVVRAQHDHHQRNRPLVDFRSRGALRREPRRPEDVNDRWLRGEGTHRRGAAQPRLPAAGVRLPPVQVQCVVTRRNERRIAELSSGLRRHARRLAHVLVVHVPRSGEESVDAWPTTPRTGVGGVGEVMRLKRCSAVSCATRRAASSDAACRIAARHAGPSRRATWCCRSTKGDRFVTLLLLRQRRRRLHAQWVVGSTWRRAPRARAPSHPGRRSSSFPVGAARCVKPNPDWTSCRFDRPAGDGREHGAFENEATMTRPRRPSSDSTGCARWFAATTDLGWMHANPEGGDMTPGPAAPAA